MKVLLEMRPAMDGHAGIPQETRLLFRALMRLPGVEVEGLLLTGGRVLAKGLPTGAKPLAPDRRLDRLSRVVVSLQPGHKVSLVAWLSAQLHLLRLPWAVLTGLPRSLGRFDARHFRDYIWRGLFAKTLLHEDFDAVTSSQFRIARTPWSVMHGFGLAMGRLGLPRYVRMDTSGLDLMVAETPFPGRVIAPTKLVVRYHDAMPMLMPHTVINRAFHQASHYSALRQNVRDGAWFACVSEATRSDLLSIFPQAEARAVTIPNMVSAHYFAEESAPSRVNEVLRARRNPSVSPSKPPPAQRLSGGAPEYLLMVSTLEPRKNHLALLSAWEQLRSGRFNQLQLVLVGALGWEHEPIVDKLKPWLDRGEVHLLEDVPAAELRLLYRHASATVCPSLGEGFDFSGIEAMRCGGAVAASDIPVHREIFDTACELFNPYAPAEIADAIARVIGPDGKSRRAELVTLGAEVSARYLPERILPQWQAFLSMLNDKT
jgi:glycosyltransferase involved in cell wall biosynthesis